MGTTDKLRDKMLGGLYGQAIGNTLGLGPEFMSKDEVLKDYPDGLKNYSKIELPLSVSLKTTLLNKRMQSAS